MKNNSIAEVLSSLRLVSLRVTDPEQLKWLYLGAVFLFWASMYFYVPTLPVYVRTQTTDLALIGAVLAQYGLWQALLRVPLGMAADWAGRRKPFILAGFVLSGAGAIIMATAGDAFGIGAGRAVTGLAAATWVPLVVIYSSLFPPEDAVRAATILTLVNSVSRMMATALTGVLNTWGGYPLAFYTGAGVAALAFLILLPAREPERGQKKPDWESIGANLIHRNVLLPSLLSAIAQYVTWATTFGFIPVLAQGMGASDTALSMLTSLNIATVLLGNLLTTFLIRRVDPKSLVYFSFILLAAGVLAAAFGLSLPYLFFATICIGLSTGINYPILMGKSIEWVKEGERATAMGLYQAIYAIGMFTGPWLSGILARALDIQPMFAVTGFICLLLGLLGTRWLSGSRTAANEGAAHSS